MRSSTIESARVAAFLVAAGVQPGDRVGLCLPKGARAIAAIFGTLKARAVYVPVDFMAPVDRNRTIFDDCDARVLFVDPSCARDLSEGSGAGSARTVVIVGESDYSPGICWEDVLGSRPGSAVAGRSDDDVAYMLYTSGSTGVPKGVVLTHRNAISFVEWCAEVFDLSETDRCSSHAPFHFDLSVFDIYVSVRHGSGLYIISENLGKSPRELAAFIADNQLTVWYSTPSILSLLAEYGGLERHDYRSVRLILFAGEVFPIKHLRRLTAVLPWPAYYNLYGPTETNVCTFTRIPTPVPDDRVEPFPIGHPCSHCDAIVLDERGAPVRQATKACCTSQVRPSSRGIGVGRPRMRGPSTSSKACAGTAPVTWYAGIRWMVYILGRRDRMVKRRGYRVELDEIQTALYGHSNVRDAAVVAVSHPEAGVRIYAYVVPGTTPVPSIIQLKQFCSQHLPDYMIPDVLRIVESLPRTSTDKVNFPALVQGSAAHSVPRSSGDVVAPRRQAQLSDPPRVVSQGAV